MKMIAAMTVVRGEGPEVDVIVNGTVNREIRAQREREKQLKQRENSLLQDRANHVRAEMAGNANAFRRIRERITDAWAMFWAIGGELGLWTWEEE